MRRDAQHLPIPLGGLAPAHATQAVRLRWAKRHRLALIYGIAALLTVVAVAVTWLPRGSAMFSSGDGVHIDDVTLRAVAVASAEQLYSGPATLLIRIASDGEQRGIAAATLNGQPTTGVCDETETRESCWFRVGAMNLGATDVFDLALHEWRRTYSDGVRVTIAVPAGTTPVPVALPLGRG